MNLKMILEKSLRYLPKITIKKAVHKSLTFTQDYLGYISDAIFGTELSDDELDKKILARTEKSHFDLFWQPSVSEGTKDKIIIEWADKAKNHVFNLLGSEDVKVDYELRAKGLEKHGYDMRLSQKEYLSIKEKIQSELEVVFQKPVGYEPIDWHVDFRSGYRWSEKVYYKFIKCGHKLGADIKLPWELSRTQHFIPLALCYRLTKKEEYAEEIINQTVDWILTNPCKFGVNWCCTMDVAIRVANWVIAVSLVKDYIDNLPLTGKEYFYKIFLKSLYQHGDFIVHNLEWSETLTSNHYLSDIAGLLVLAILTEGIFKEAEKWKKFAIRELKKEMFKQVYPGGTDFEASTCYHRLVLELFFYSIFFVVQSLESKVKCPESTAQSQRDNLPSSAINYSAKDYETTDYKTVAEEIFGKDCVDRLYKMFDAVAYLLKPNGRMPQIGDNDNGQFIKLYFREVLDMRYLLALGAVFFKEPKWKIREFFLVPSPNNHEQIEDIAEITLLFGKRGLDIWKTLEWNELRNIKTKAFPDAGWYVMRHDKDYCLISCGPNGQEGKGGHCHNDKLSFELCINGKDIIVDPGTYVYTPCPEWRNRFRSTAYHNTIMVNGKEHNRFHRCSLFSVKGDAQVNVNKWEITEECDFLDVQHDGYRRLKQFVIHRRQIIFDKKRSHWTIKDTLNGKGMHTFELYFHFAPMRIGVLRTSSDALNHVKKIRNKIIEGDFKTEESLTIETQLERGTNVSVVPINPEGLRLKISQGWVSYGYGIKEKASIAKFLINGICPVEQVIVLFSLGRNRE